MTDKEQIQYERRINFLQKQLSESRQREADLIIKYGADCTSCKHQGDGKYCDGCPAGKPSKYEPMGVDK